MWSGGGVGQPDGVSEHCLVCRTWPRVAHTHIWWLKCQKWSVLCEQQRRHAGGALGGFLIQSTLNTGSLTPESAHKTDEPTCFPGKCPYWRVNSREDYDYEISSHTVIPLAIRPHPSISAFPHDILRCSSLQVPSPAGADFLSPSSCSESKLTGIPTIYAKIIIDDGSVYQ